jgi:hypothetical protein
MTYLDAFDVIHAREGREYTAEQFPRLYDGNWARLTD